MMLLYLHQKNAELIVYTSVYIEASLEILPCCAPLKKGGIC
jgi:UV-stimulated scaffold protein A